VKQKIDRKLLRNINFLSFWGVTVLSALGGMGSGIAATGFMHNLGFGITAMLVVGMMMMMVDIPIIIYI